MGLRTWLLRRAMGRLRIDDDVVRHLSTFQRLGETVEVELPGELLPIGARTVFRALRTRAASQIGPDWVWPHWLERQCDPASPAFVPRGHLPFLTNLTDRSWTMVGNLDSPWEAIVDRRGLVTPWFDGWSLDWWIGADDRWHLPSREVGVRQGLLDAAPVVETRLRVPGGDAVQRTYAMRTPARPGEPEGDELVIVEITNETSVPFAVALGVRPYNPEGLSVIERVELHDTTISVDGRPAVLLPRAPSRVAASTFHDGDSARTVLDGDAGERFPSDVRCKAGMAQAAVVYPLAHGATLRVGLPMVPVRRTRRRGLARRRARRSPSLPAALPSAAQVASGWRSQTDRGMRLELPDPRLQEAVDANRRYLLLFHDGDEITPGPTTYHRFWFRDAAYMIGALDRYGFHDEAAQVLASYPERQRVDGFFFSQRHEWDANGCALWTMAHHWRLTRDRDLLQESLASIVRGLHWIERKRRTKRRRDPALEGLLPAGISAEHLGPFDFFYWDDLWGIAGMEAGAEMLEALGEHDGAADARRGAAAFRADVLASMDLAAERLGTAAIPAGPLRRIDAGAIGSLVACAPLGLLAADDARIAATADVVRDRFCQGPAFFQGISHTGLGTYLTLQLASVELEAGDRRALDRLDWLLDAATPTWTWPEAVHPRLPGGCMGDGHHGWAAADMLSFVRAMVVRETCDGLALASLVPEGWLGRGWEVHDAPTRWGRLSCAVRWHGERPALLWELVPHEGVGPVTITAPGLDPGWSSRELCGDALLAAPTWAAGLTPAAELDPMTEPGSGRGAGPGIEPGASFG
jgi:hypothetical protein